EGRLLVRRPHVGEHHSLVLERRVGAVAEAILEGAVRWLARRVEDSPIDVEVPAVIAALDAPLSDDAELQRRPAVAAMELQQPDAPALVTKDDEVLAEDANAPREIFQLGRQLHRQP